MSLLIPAPRGYGQNRNYSGRPSTSWGTSLTASATPHTEGTVTSVIASTAYESNIIRVYIHGTRQAAVSTDALVNIYLGTTHLLIANLFAGWAAPMNNNFGAYFYEFPIRIPRGVQLSASLRALIASETLSVVIQLLATNEGHWAGAGVESVGAVTASSRGTTITPGTTAEGAFTSLGTTVKPFAYVYAATMSNVDVTMTGGWKGIDLGVGGVLVGGAENYVTGEESGERSFTPFSYGTWVQVAAGTALQARLQDSGTDAEAKSVIAWGVY